MKGPGSTQRFILDELSTLPEGEWMLLSELIDRFIARDEKDSSRISLDRNVRNAARSLAHPMGPKVEQRWIDGKVRIRLTWFGRAFWTDPWTLKRREMPGVWAEIQAEQSRELRKKSKR